MKILVIGAHTDDIEIMCGGTLARLIEERNHVSYCTFSFANESLPPGFPPGTTLKEANKSAETLGIAFLDRYLFDYEVRKFPENRQEILEDMIELRNAIDPELVITHNSWDTHQDHGVISREVFRAFKQTSTIWGFESFKNNVFFRGDLYVRLGKKHIDKKLKAIENFKSQLAKNDHLEALTSLAKFRGAQINAPYAECFEIKRAII